MTATRNPFAPPLPTVAVVDARPRADVVVRATVRRSEVVRWAGGDVREVTVADLTGEITLVFFGRREVGGVQVGRELTVAGTVVAHRDRPVLMSPQLWLTPVTPAAVPAAPAEAFAALPAELEPALALAFLQPRAHPPGRVRAST